VKIMIIAAHPDDEILGCGGTVARLINEGAEGYTLILGQGRMPEYVVLGFKEYDKQLREWIESIKQANLIIGTKKIYLPDANFLPDNQFDSVPLLTIVRFIENEIKDYKPDLIFTHYANDLNIDHRITYQAVITATRPMQNESVKEIYSFEVLSSTEWNYPTTFSPDTFYDITDTINTKLQALACYESEMRDSRHPRSITGVWNNAKMWGLKSGLEYAEAFKTVRSIR